METDCRRVPGTVAVCLTLPSGPDRVDEELLRTAFRHLAGCETCRRRVPPSTRASFLVAVAARWQGMRIRDNRRSNAG